MNPPLVFIGHSEGFSGLGYSGSDALRQGDPRQINASLGHQAELGVYNRVLPVFASPIRLDPD